MAERQSNCSKQIKPGAFAFFKKKSNACEKFPKEIQKIKGVFLREENNSHSVRRFKASQLEYTERTLPELDKAGRLVFQGQALLSPNENPLLSEQWRETSQDMLFLKRLNTI